MRERDKEFEHYFEKNYPSALKYVRSKVFETSDAEDIVADAFYKCYENFDKFDPAKASFSTWLYVILNNKLRNYYRDRKTTSELDESIAGSNSMEDEILGAIHLGELRNQLADALMALADVPRSIIIMKYFRNMNSKEIGAQLGLSDVNIRVQLSRALSKLRKEMSAHGYEME